MNTQCPNCGSPTRFVKAGRSKKPPYKPYPAFQACTNELCGTKFNLGNPEGNQDEVYAPAPVRQPQPQYQPESLDSWNGASKVAKTPDNSPSAKELEDDLNKRSALDKSIQFAIARIAQGDKVTSDQVIGVAEKFLSFLKNGEVQEEVGDLPEDLGN